MVNEVMSAEVDRGRLRTADCSRSVPYEARATVSSTEEAKTRLMAARSSAG
jgi:hypothetical protein